MPAMSGIRLEGHQMKKLISISAIAALIGLPLIAMAQTLPILPNTVPAGTAVCRPAKAHETANASMGTTPMMCQSVDVVKVNAALKKLRAEMAKQKAAPSAQTDASTQEMLQAQAQLNKEFHVPVIPGGNGGIED